MHKKQKKAQILHKKKKGQKANELMLIFQYEWNENERFLFQSALAFAMRNHIQGQDFK